MQLLSEFIGKQKIRLVGVGVSRLRERDERQTLDYGFLKYFSRLFKSSMLWMDI